MMISIKLGATTEASDYFVQWGPSLVMQIFQNGFQKLPQRCKPHEISHFEVERKPYSMKEVEDQTETGEMAEDLKESITSNDENSEDIDDDEYAEFDFKRNNQKQVKFALSTNEVVQPPVYTDDEYGLSGHSSSEGDREYGTKALALARGLVRPDDDIHKIRCYDGSERLFRTMGTQFSDADFSKWFSEVTATLQGGPIGRC
ncbi:hypothetical protein FGIG_02514 [Fasciola gigantica]|uniref:Uncharacterized protein n=1 Tax=Fasciola gigantica TaxID=46835 RepID=A0A504YKY9_FASGI|nr:hypothetical protein FGIG_02514 [Fasciola gigantica]